MLCGCCLLKTIRKILPSTIPRHIAVTMCHAIHPSLCFFRCLSLSHTISLSLSHTHTKHTLSLSFYRLYVRELPLRPIPEFSESLSLSLSYSHTRKHTYTHTFSFSLYTYTHFLSLSFRHTCKINNNKPRHNRTHIKLCDCSSMHGPSSCVSPLLCRPSFAAAHGPMGRMR